MYLTQPLHRNRQQRARAPATMFARRTRSWGEVADRVARVAAGLKSLGLVPGERLAILALNSDEYLILYYAAFWAGGVAVPLNWRSSAAELATILSDAEPVILAHDARLAPVAAGLAAQRPALRLVQMDAAAPVDGAASLEALAAHPPAADAEAGGSTLAAIFYTGGTTGTPKGVMLSHDNLFANALCTAAITRLDPSVCFLHAAPMFHLADAAMVFGLSAIGGRHVMIPHFDAAAVVRAIAEDGVNALFLVPTMIALVLDLAAAQGADLTRVERLTYGAAPISEALLRRAMAAFPNARFQQGYGQTELSPVATMLTHEDHLAGRLGSAGRSVLGVDVIIADAQGQPLPPGQVGEIRVRSPGAMLGYWRQPEVTAATLVNGWVRTGDAGVMDEDGYLTVVDRLKDMIISGGENVYSVEVEDALMAHPAVAMCAVIAVPDPRWGERVHAVVQVRAPVKPEELSAHCHARIADYKCPRSWDLREQPLPVSAQGKVLKAQLRAPFWEGQSRRVA
jgi:long-chain acyl-CoA synthetase